MVNKTFLVILTAITVLLGACSSNDQKEEENSTLQIVEVDIKTTPEKLEKDRKVSIQAHVSQGNENVDDADDVQFEIWKSDNENHEMMDGIHQGDGVYSVDTTFMEDGIYYVIAHVNARNLHTMPRVELEVGLPASSSN
jgi:hypothetical protein